MNRLITGQSSTLSSSSSSPAGCSMGMINYPDMGSLSLGPNDRASAWGFYFMGNCNNKTRSFEENQNSSDNCCSDGFEEDNRSPTINLNNAANLNEEEMNPNENGVSGANKETDCGQSKLCARGHWRPAEDTKLKELVALYGPQNWNLIAEKLEGRSGNPNRH